MKHFQKWMLFVMAACLAGLQTSCVTPPLQSFDVSQSGWIEYQGQAVWRPIQKGPTLAGNLHVALHRDGRALLQFIKDPMPIAVAQLTPPRWQIRFVPQKKSFAGRGRPHRRLVWLQLLVALQDRPIHPDWKFERKGADWTLSNVRTGEQVQGFLQP